MNIEHIVVDPGSKDGSTEIARQAPGVTLIAEPDRGQSDGISKGFSRSTGDILVWLNSDDFYPDEHVLASVVQCFLENPDVDIVYGDVNFVDESGAFLRKGFVNKNSDQLLDSFQYQVGIVQPGVFWRRRVFEEIGGPSDAFEYCMDYELWVRMASKGYKWKYLPKVLAHHRWWGGMKTSSRRDLSLKEHFKVCDRYFGYAHWKWLDRYADYLCSNQDGVVNHASSINAEEKAAAIRLVVDEVITQEMLRKLSTSSEVEQVATHQYIATHYPEKNRVYFEQDELKIASERSDDPKASQRVAWNIFDVETEAGSHLSAYHVPDNFDRYFDKSWHLHQLDRANSALKVLRKERRGDVCVIVGNGPSLRKSDLSLLENVDTIISNFAVMSPQLSRYAKILTVVNDLVARQGALDFNTSKFIKFVPFWLGNYFNADKNTYFVNATVKPEFGTDFVNSASWRSTVSFFNMQLAYAIGYRKVILIGFDNSYVQPQGVVEGVVINQLEDDENHFDARYFKGKDWQAADTVNMEKMYVVAKAAFEQDGREIVNCTVGGKLETFRRSDFSKELTSRASTYWNRFFTITPSMNFKEIRQNHWLYTHSDARQKLWQAVSALKVPALGRCYSGSLRIESNKAMTIMVSVDRNGSSAYEGASTCITLVPGIAQSVHLLKEFSREHAGLRMQIDVQQLEGGGTAELIIDSVSVNETLASIVRRLPESDMSVTEADRLFDSGDYSTAMGIYLLLYQQHGLENCEDKAMVAARRLGFDGYNTADELIQLVQ